MDARSPTHRVLGEVERHAEHVRVPRECPGQVLAAAGAGVHDHGRPLAIAPGARESHRDHCGHAVEQRPVRAAAEHARPSGDHLGSVGGADAGSATQEAHVALPRDVEDVP